MVSTDRYCLAAYAVDGSGLLSPAYFLIFGRVLELPDGIKSITFVSVNDGAEGEYGEIAASIVPSALFRLLPSKYLKKTFEAPK
jgi:hypothetical protein